MGFISIGNEQLSYRKMGAGARIALAFHGYGDNADTFELLEEPLKKEYTLLSFDLPHHGHSQWAPNAILTKTGLAALVTRVMTEYNVTKVSLLGYSLGGRICATIITRLPASIDKVVLVAPDGLKPNIYYSLFIRTGVGLKVFKHIMEHPENYFRAIDWLMDRKLIDPTRYKFVMHSVGLEAGRKRLFRIWTCLKDITEQPEKIRAAINRHSIPVTIFMGAKDKIMPPFIAQKFKKGTRTVQVFVLDKGHRIIDHENAHQIAAHLL